MIPRAQRSAGAGRDGLPIRRKRQGLARRTRGPQSRGARGPSGCRARRSCSRRSRSVADRWPAWSACRGPGLTIARLWPSEANAVRPNSADSSLKRSAPLATSTTCVQPSPIKATDRPSREKTARSMPSKPPGSIAGTFSRCRLGDGPLLPGRDIPAPEGAVAQCGDHGGAIPAERHTPGQEDASFATDQV